MAALIYDEVELFLICVALGAMLAFIYDLIRMFRMMLHHRDWLVDVEDLLFWILTAWMVFHTLFVYNRGALRGYAFLGMFIGVVLYVMTLSRLLLFGAGKIIPYLRRPFLFFHGFFRKRLKNIITQVKMAIKSR